MKLTIVHPCVGRIPGVDYMRTWQMEPLPPAYLAALAPDDVEIAFYDDRLEAIPFDEPTDLVAISVETYTAMRAYQIATEYRRRGVPVVMGGFHTTLVPDEVADYAEAIVVGESEQSFPQLIRDFRAGKMKRRYQQAGRADVSTIVPDRSIFAGKKYLKIGLVEAARGCLFECEFCAVTSFFGATQSHRPIEVVLEEIRSLKDKKKLFFFVDDNIASFRNWAKEFYKALIPLKIRWISQASITATYDDELLAIMKASGCQGVLIGFESLNTKNLDAMSKSFNHAKGGFEPALAKLKKYGIRLYSTFIFGYEHDTEASIAETVAFCKRHKIFMAAFNHITPFPGTPLYAKLEKEGRLLYDKWWLDPNYRYGDVPFETSIDPKILRDRCLEARQSFYGVPSIISRYLAPMNFTNGYMNYAYWVINLMLRKESTQRHQYPLGDESFEGGLLPVTPASLEKAGVTTCLHEVA